MAKSSHPDRKEIRESNGRFLPGEYSPARRPVTTAYIPPRASAHPLDVVKVRPRYPRVYTDKGIVEHDVTRIPTMPPAVAVWQYETPRYEAESSLSSLSLAVSEATYVHSPAIDEIDTTPPPQNVISLEDKRKESRNRYALANTQKPDKVEHDNVLTISSAQEVLSTPMRHPFGRFRWWLLAPGRIELILWICGTVVLICVTGLLVFILADSMGFFQTSAPQNAASNMCNTEGRVQNRVSDRENCTLSTVASPTGLRVTMVNGDLMETGTMLRLQGQGFHPLGRITITHDGNVPCQPNVMQANEHGEFAVAIRLDEKKYWGAGRHQITVNDTGSKQSIILTIMLEPQK